MTSFITWLGKFTVETLKEAQERYIKDLEAQRAVYQQTFAVRLEIAANLSQELREARQEAHQEHTALLGAIRKCLERR